MDRWSSKQRGPEVHLLFSYMFEPSVGHGMPIKSRMFELTISTKGQGKIKKDHFEMHKADFKAKNMEQGMNRMGGLLWRYHMYIFFRFNINIPMRKHIIKHYFNNY